MGLEPADFTRESLLTALDFVCADDREAGRLHDPTARIDDALYRRWRTLNPLHAGERETLAYDLTSVLFFGVSCPLAELGYNPKRVTRRQANLALVVSRRDRFPLTHFVYGGSRNAPSTIKNLILALQESSVEPGTLIWDRGNVSGEHVEAATAAGWHLVCGVPLSVNDARDIVERTQLEYNHETLARGSKGVIQDATFITADPGHAKADEPRGDGAKTRRSKDGTWVKKGKRSEFGYKLHMKMDTSYELIRDYDVTTASLHDSQIDLTRPGEVNRRDRGYHGAPCKGFNATMRRGARGHPIGIRDKMRNLRISRKRAPGERPFAVIKCVFGSGHVLVTTVGRVAVKMMFACFGFDLYQLHALRRAEVI